MEVDPSGFRWKLPIRRGKNSTRLLQRKEKKRKGKENFKFLYFKKKLFIDFFK
jgi:hypothetical protein